MPNQLLPETEWNRNVGTPAFPVSFLHEYAVGLLWDRLQGNDKVIVKTLDGCMSGNLLNGADRVVIPDSMQPIGGCIPDLALLDKDLRPVRIIEVIVTSAPAPEKMEKLTSLQQRGVEIVLVPVRNEEELKALMPSKADGKVQRWAYGWSPTVLEQMGIINIPRKQMIRSGQSHADAKVKELIKALG